MGVPKGGSNGWKPTTLAEQRQEIENAWNAIPMDISAYDVQAIFRRRDK